MKQIYEAVQALERQISKDQYAYCKYLEKILAGVYSFITKF